MRRWCGVYPEATNSDASVPRFVTTLVADATVRYPTQRVITCHYVQGTAAYARMVP